MLTDEIKEIINSRVCGDEDVRSIFLKRLEEGSLTRDENPETHFCVYFLPFNKKENKFFIVHHKKSGLWISPGGHIDKGENLLEALNREIKEELGLKAFFLESQRPFFLTVTPIEDKSRSCKVHFDIWYLVLTDGSSFYVDQREFFETKWVTVDEAKNIVGNRQNLDAFDVIRKKYESTR